MVQVQEVLVGSVLAPMATSQRLWSLDGSPGRLGEPVGCPSCSAALVRGRGTGMPLYSGYKLRACCPVVERESQREKT